MRVIISGHPVPKAEPVNKVNIRLKLHYTLSLHTDPVPDKIQRKQSKDYTSVNHGTRC